MAMFSTNAYKTFFIWNNTTTNTMKEHTLKNVSNCLNTNIYSYLETSGGQSSDLYLKDVHFFNITINKTSVAA
jgi:hypothetical protein